MARTRAERSRSKSAILDEITQGMERLQSFIPQIEDLGRDGFPYLEGARARTELQIKECIRKTFGEKSPEFQTYRQHRLSVDTPADTKQTVGLIKSLITSLEDKKSALLGLKLPPPAEPLPAPTPAARPHMSLVPPTPTAQVTITPTAPVIPPPMTMSVALTTTLDMTKTTDAASALPPAVTNRPITAPEPSPVAPIAPIQVAIPVSPPPVSHKAAPLVRPAPDQAAPPEPTLIQPMAKESVAPIPTKEPSVHRRAEPPALEQPMHELCETIKSLCKRFHLVARQLRLRGEYRATLDVEDELDVQDLLHALLRLHFDDIETDEWLPSYSNGGPRITFLLDDSRLAVVVKKTRTGLHVKDLAEQLRIDIDHCRTLTRCSTLLCFIYDPEGRIGNPRGLEADLISISDQLTVDMYVAPK